jgi:hypothetical protein
MDENSSAATISDFTLSNLSISSTECQNNNLNQTEEIIKFYSKHNLTFSALKDTYELAGKNKSQYFISKDIDKYTKYDYFLNIWCCKCKIYKSFKHENKKKYCDGCLSELKPKETNYFVHIPLKQQLMDLVTQNYEEIMKYNEKMIETNNNANISDIHNCSVYLKNLANSPNKIPLSLVVNIDGVKVFNFGADSLWPVQLYLNFLPPRIRYLKNNILLIGLYYGSSANLDIHSLMLPICQEMNDLSVGFRIKKKPEICFLPVITHAAMDLPAKHKLLCFKQYNSEFGCTICTQKGESINNKSGKGKTKRFLYTSKLCPLRTHEETVDIMVSIKPNERKKGIKGIKDISPLVSLQKFNLIEGFGTDYMHGILRGAFFKEVELWLETGNNSKEYYIQPKKREIINKRISKIQGTSEMNKPRSIDHFATFKAHELREFLLYYFPVILDGIVLNKYLNHLKILSECTYVLLKSKISTNDIEMCEKKIEEYVHTFEVLYKKSNVTINVHMLRHLTSNVKNLGPLWSFSTFGFESNNGVLKRHVKGARNVISQVTKKYILNQSSFSTHSKLKLPTMLLGKSKLIKICGLHKSAFNNLLDADEINIHASINKGSTKFTSTYYSLTTSIDYFVMFINNNIGKALYYFNHDEKIYVLIELYNQTKEGHSHFFKIRTSN